MNSELLVLFGMEVCSRSETRRQRSASEAEWQPGDNKGNEAMNGAQGSGHASPAPWVAGGESGL
jgi:hypothetical protein